jgi:hypothetical protein
MLRTSPRNWLLALSAVLCVWAGPTSAAPSREAHALAYARRLPVIRLDPQLRREPFEPWLRKVVGPTARLSWSVNDCGEQTGTPADRGRDFPMCAEVTATRRDGVTVTIAIQVGSFKRGVTGSPALRSVALQRGADVVDVSTLRELPLRLARATRRPATPKPGAR